MTNDDGEQIIWLRPEATGRGKAPGYSRKQIAMAAIKIADADGVGAVSMRRVAAEIGAGAMSLYRYVRNKEELYSLMVDEVLDPGELAAETPPWRELLWETAHDIRALIKKHPWFPELQSEVAFPGPNSARGLEYALRCLDGLGLTIDEMMEIAVSVMYFVTAYTQNSLAAQRTIQRSGLTREQWQKRQEPYVLSLIDSDDFPYLRRVVLDANLPHRDDDTNFDRAVGRLLAGIDATMPKTPKSSKTPKIPEASKTRKTSQIKRAEQKNRAKK